MRVFHIIPSAFEYFGDIYDQAFTMVDKLNEAGVEANALSIQFGTTKQSDIEHTSKIAPARKYVGSFSVATGLEEMVNYDIVHLHFPTFGASGRIVSCLKKFKEIPLVITYYHPARLSDLFSAAIILSNWWYKPKFFKRAQVVVNNKVPVEKLIKIYSDFYT